MCNEAVGRRWKRFGAGNWVDNPEAQRVWRDHQMTVADTYTNYGTCAQILGRERNGA